jgi:Domain of unknown function (DUF4375)
MTDLEELLRAHMSRPLPQRLDVEILAATPDELVADMVYDFALGKIGDDVKKEQEVVMSFREGVRNLYVSRLLNFEVGNGGFNQFYFNSSGKFALLAPAAFEYFGAQMLANIVRNANAVRASEAKWIRAVTRIRTIESFMESYRHTKLQPLGEQYWRHNESLGALWLAKIRSCPEDFCGY